MAGDPGVESGGKVPASLRGDSPGRRRPPRRSADEPPPDPDRAAELVRFWYRRHADRVYRYARWRTGSRTRAEEVVSDVFLEAWRSADGYDPEKGSVESWLLGVARNVIRRARRERSREAERRGGPDDLDDLASPRPGPAEEAERRRRAEALLDAVWELPKDDRDLVALAYGADLSRRRIAELLGLSPGAVRVRLHRALERLRERLDEGS